MSRSPCTNEDCALYHEGYCSRSDIRCDGRTRQRLITEEEYEQEQERDV